MFAALIMGMPLALTLARSYGVVDDIDLGRRSTGVLIGAFLVILGNVGEQVSQVGLSVGLRCGVFHLL